jgi:hypothetical protein
MRSEEDRGAGRRGTWQSRKGAFLESEREIILLRE